MSNRLLELQTSLKLPPRPATRPRLKPRKKNAAASPPVGEAVAAKGFSLRTRRTRVSYASQAVNYRVPGVVEALAQPSSMTCWATVTTIMVMWRKQVSMSIQTAIGQIGATYLAKFNANQGLTGAEKPGFLAAAGLAYQAPQSLSVQGWEALLRQYGPLWVTTDEDPTAGFSIHARVMICIRGDGTTAGTTVEIVDPAGGRTYAENFGTFQRKFESEALDPKRPLRIQIVHWPQAVGFGVGRAQRAQALEYAEGLDAGRFSTVDPAEFEPHYNEAKPDERSARAQSTFTSAFAGTKKLTAADVKWASDADSIDYRHLGTAIDTKPFALTPAVLARLVQLGRFDLKGQQKVVFGLRGCTLDADVASFVSSVTIREIEPNHIDNRCIIGVWDRTNNKVTAFQASTVPNWEYMEAYREDHGKKANILPTGRYSMVVGTHRPKKKSGGTLVDNPGRVQGALRNDQEVLVLRSEDDLTYTIRDTWDQTIASDNIHPGIVPVNAGASTVPDYSSAGCNTIPGTSRSDHPDGAWANFRTALGLDNANPTSHDGTSIVYVLLTGREARMCAAGLDESKLVRLRFGSSGDAVRKLQELLRSHPKKFLASTPDGDFGPGTAMAFVKYQKHRDGGAADAIVTPTDATALGFSLAAPTASEAKGIDDFIGKVIDVGRGILKRWAQRPEEGRFTFQSDIAELMHDDTPPIVQWHKTTASFAVRATSPGVSAKDVIRSIAKGDDSKVFKFVVDFEYNGYDIRNAQIRRDIQNSSGLTGGKFSAVFTAKKATIPKAEVGRIDFILNGKWDPGLGDKQFDFSGKVWVEGDGDHGFELNKNDRVSIEMTKGQIFSDVTKTDFPPPTIFRKWHAVFFSPPGSDKVTDDEMARLKAWLRELKKDDVRYRRLREGTITVNAEGYASATGKGQSNQALSGRRVDKVIALLKDELGSAAKIVRAAHGEDDPSQKVEKEDQGERRVDVWFEVPL